MEHDEDRAKLFRHGGSQAVRLPKRYRFENQDEVIIQRENERVILEPIRRSFSRRFLELAGAVPDFPYPSEQGNADEGPSLD